MWDHGSLYNSSCDDDTSRKEPKVNENRAPPRPAHSSPLASAPGSCTAVQSQAGPPADLCPRPLDLVWEAPRRPGQLLWPRRASAQTPWGRHRARGCGRADWGRPRQGGSTGSADLLRGREAPVKPPGRVGAFSKCHMSWSTRKGREWRAGASACADDQKR